MQVVTPYWLRSALSSLWGTEPSLWLWWAAGNGRLFFHYFPWCLLLPLFMGPSYMLKIISQWKISVSGFLVPLRDDKWPILPPAAGALPDMEEWAGPAVPTQGLLWQEGKQRQRWPWQRYQTNSQKQLGALPFKTSIYLNSGGLKIEDEKPR